MGKRLPAGVGATGTPVAGDNANGVISGTITAVAPTNPFCFYGGFNVLIWAQLNDALTTTAGSTAATVASGTGVVAGQTITSVNVPPGTTVGAIAGTNVTLAVPPNYTDANVITGTDNAAQFGSAAWVGSIQLERTFDGGQSYQVAGVGGGGQSAIYTGAGQAGNAVSIVVGEVEQSVAYRLNCTAYTPTAGVTINYRISTTGAAALTWGIQNAF